MQSDYSKKIVQHLSNLERHQLETLLRNSVKNEQFLSNIINSIPEAIVVISRSGKVIFANSMVYDLMGIHVNEIINKSLIENIRDAALKEKLLRTDQKSFYTFNVNVKYPRLLSLDVQTIPLSFNSTEKNKPSCLITIRDATYEQTQNTKKSRETRFETMRLLTAGVAHEIGNPLSAIILHTQIMDRILKKVDGSDEINELKQINRVINEESARLKRIVADFLNAVRPLSVNFEFSDITYVLDETFQLLNEELKSKNIRLIKDYSDVPKTMFDADQMRSVFINIIKNAIDAMSDNGELVVAVTAKGNWIEISFSDNGQGMDSARLKRIFDPFFTTKTNGSGLGMLIVQRIINSHNGTVKVNSAPGEGTTVILEIPIRNIPGKKSLPLPNTK